MGLMLDGHPKSSPKEDGFAGGSTSLHLAVGLSRTYYIGRIGGCPERKLDALSGQAS